MVQKVAPSLPSRIFTAVMPQNRIVQIALGIIAVLVVVRFARGLFGRATSSANAHNTALKEYTEGQAQLKAGNEQEAYVHFQKAYDLKPTDKNLRAMICLKMGTLLLNSDRQAEAPALFDEVLKINPPRTPITVDAHIQKNVFFDRKKNYGEALVHLKQALSLNEDESMVPSIHLRMAFMHVRSDQWIEADAELTLALVLTKQSRFFCSLLIGIAEMSVPRGQLVLARRAAEFALRYCPDGDTKMQAEAVFVMATVYDGEKNFKECFKMLGEVLSNLLFPIDIFRAEILSQRALVRMKISDDVDFPEANRYQDALNSFNLSLEAIPKERSDFCAVVLWRQAVVHLEWGNKDAALIALRDANVCPGKTEQLGLKIQELELEIGLREATEQHKRGDNAEALEKLNHLLDVLKPTDKKQLRDVYILRGEICSDLGNFDEALTAYGLALGLDPSELEKTRIQLGMSYIFFVQQDDPAKAMQTAQAALDAFPGKDESLVTILMKLALLESDLTNAIQYATDAFIRVPAAEDLNDLAAETLRLRATFLFEQKNYEKAVEHLKTALGFASEENIDFHVQCYMELGLSYKAMGKKELALTEFLSAQKLSQDDEVKERITQELAELDK